MWAWPACWNWNLELEWMWQSELGKSVKENNAFQFDTSFLDCRNHFKKSYLLKKITSYDFLFVVVPTRTTSPGRSSMTQWRIMTELRKPTKLCLRSQYARHPIIQSILSLTRTSRIQPLRNSIFPLVENPWIRSWRHFTTPFFSTPWHSMKLWRRAVPFQMVLRLPGECGEKLFKVKIVSLISPHCPSI